MHKRSLDEDSKKQTARKIEDDFERTEDDALPLACSICRQPFSAPVITKCQHYFCHHCALKYHGKNSTCFVCSQPTLGIFNIAVGIKNKIAKEHVKAKAMVDEVSQMLGKASDKVGNAKSTAAEAAEMVKEVETLVEKAAVLAEKAVDKAVDAREMVQEADAIVKTAKTEIAKAFTLMKIVKWNG